MTLEEVLSCPDAEIVRSGQMTVIIAKEYRRITGNEPSACDCQTKIYLRVIRQFYITTMTNDVYYDGRYYDLSKITKEEKENILTNQPSLYIRLFGELPKVEIPKPVVEYIERPVTKAKRSTHKKK